MTCSPSVTVARRPTAEAVDRAAAATHSPGGPPRTSVPVPIGEDGADVQSRLTA